MLLLLLPGTSTSYYGDEIGMLNVEVTGESQDPVGKDDKVCDMTSYTYAYILKCPCRFLHIHGSTYMGM